jgi:hypothetical protein
MWLDKTMNKILNEAEEHFRDKGVTREQIKEVFNLYWVIIASFMRDIRFPRIHIPKFGYFIPKVTFIKEKLWSFKNNPKWEEMGEFYAKHAEEALERIKMEHKKRKRNEY